jgi:hypothetical protein
MDVSFKSVLCVFALNEVKICLIFVHQNISTLIAFFDRVMSQDIQMTFLQRKMLQRSKSKTKKMRHKEKITEIHKTMKRRKKNIRILLRLIGRYSV